MRALSHWLVEISPPADGWAEIQDATARARAVTQELRTAGESIRFIRSVYAPEDARCFFVYEALSERAIVDAVLRAGLDVASIAGASRPSLGRRTEPAAAHATSDTETEER